PLVIQQLNELGYEVYKKYSFKAIIIALKSKYIFVSHSCFVDIMPFVNTNNVDIVQLWHGLPLKKIHYDDDYNLQNDRIFKIKKRIVPFIHEEYKLITACSSEDQRNFKSAFRSENVFITGYSRNDLLLKSKNNINKTILYLPTFRDDFGSEVDLFSNYNFCIQKWDDYLKSIGYTLLIKMHPANKPSKLNINKFNETTSIKFLNENIDILDCLAQSDILITDYSSVYFDYLLLDKPIIFSPFDFQKYISNDRKLYYNYDEVTPGPKCYDWVEVLDWTKKFNIDPDCFKEERNSIKNRFHKYIDDGSSKRIFNLLNKIK
ncbi:MAG: CDP-glycerol glycerophosphotransferase family protein, partial [Candidatus Kapaibacteriota bacterium]